MVWNSAVDQTMRLPPASDGSIRHSTDAIARLLSWMSFWPSIPTSDRIASRLGSPACAAASSRCID